MLRLLIGGALGTVLLTACASEKVKAQAQKEKSNKDDYVWFTPLGSNIPIKIPKDQARASEAETDRTQQVFREVQQAGVKTPGDSAPPTGK